MSGGIDGGGLSIPRGGPMPRRGERYPGIHAIEVYVPRHCVQADALEVEHDCKGKYTDGLQMRQWGACDEDEDVVSMARTAVRRLVEKQGLAWEDIGMLNVGTESLLDRSKSIKSHLMDLFPPGVFDVEGVDYYHACYGGTASLFACTNWVGCEAWDGRWAIVVCTDVSDAPPQYPFMNGAACVAMLVGANAPLHLEGQRHTHMVHAWDFYKPVGWPSMGPIIDGPASMELYYDCLVACQAGLIERGEGAWVDSHDHLVFHLGSSPKFVRHAFERALAAARGAAAAEVKAVVKEAVEAMAARVVVGAAAAADGAAAGAPVAAAGDAGEHAGVEGEAEAAEVEALFSKLVAPSLVLAARIGPCHTAATYVNLASLLLHDPPKLGATIGIFSYGSGAASSIFKLRVRGEARVGEGLLESLDAREVHNGGDFSALTKRFADTYGRFGWEPRVRGAPSVGAYRLEECDALGRRSYKYLEVALAERYSEAELRSHREGLVEAARDKVARAAEAARAQAAQQQQQQAGATDTNALVAGLLALLTANQAAAGQAA